MRELIIEEKRFRYLLVSVVALFLFYVIFCTLTALVPAAEATREVEQKKVATIEPEKLEVETKEVVLFPSYNETIVKDSEGRNIVTNPDSNLVLVNKDRGLPMEYNPSDLVVVDIPFVNTSIKERMQLRSEAALALQQMFKDAKAQGMELIGVSGYRSPERQRKIHNDIKKKQGTKALTVSAPPGFSEHQTGLVMDISSKAHGPQLTTSFGKTAEGKWVAEQAAKYGYIVHYLEDKTAETGYSYEPWHLRYVGNPYATELYENGLTLEEVIK